MSFALNAEQQLLRDNARELIQQAAPVGHLRRLRDQRDPIGVAQDLWRQMADLGWVGACIPEAYGGIGLGYTELGLVLEECGRTLVPTPFLSTVLLSAGVLLEAGSTQQRATLLPAISSGQLIAALAFEERPRFSPHHVACKAERVGSGYRLTGHKSFVLDGHIAERLIVSARTSGNVDDPTGISLFLVDAAATGLRVSRSALIDSHNAASLTLEGVAVEGSELIGTLGQGAAVLDAVVDRATIALCAEMLGLCTQAFETTVDYLKTRVQFDVPIGSFQALQHRAVNMFCKLELARSLVLDALGAIDERRDDVARAASAAKACLTELSRLVTREAVQLHGGIGMTDEHDIGLYLKRGAVTEATFGDSGYHRDRFARLSGF